MGIRDRDGKNLTLAREIVVRYFLIKGEGPITLGLVTETEGTDALACFTDLVFWPAKDNPQIVLHSKNLQIK